MLRAVPKSMFSWRFVIYDGDDAEVAQLHLAAIQERGSLLVNGIDCTIGREPGWGAFILEAEGHELVRAVKPSAFVRRYELIYEGQAYRLQANSLFTRTFELWQDEALLGTITAEHPFTRKAEVDLPEALPLVVRVFMLWLVLLLWKRAAESSSSS